MLQREFPTVKFIQSEANVGFATGNNLGAAQAAGRVLLFLNPDTEVSADALNQLLRALGSEPDAGLVGARLLNTDRSLQTSCVQNFPTVLNQVLDSELLRRLFPRSSLWGVQALFTENNAPKSVEVISGACIMIKREVFDSIGGFDQHYFMYSEDLDLCYRVKAAGFECLYVPGAQIVHHGGGSSSAAKSMFSVVMMRESVSRFFRSHHSSFHAMCYRLALGISALLRIPLILLMKVVQVALGNPRFSAPVKKWIAILRWSIGLERWAKEKRGGTKNIFSVHSQASPEEPAKA